MSTLPPGRLCKLDTEPVLGPCTWTRQVGCAIAPDGVRVAAPGRAGLVAAGLAALLGAGGLGWWSWSAHKVPGQETAAAAQAGNVAKPVPGLSLVVLPFANLSNGPEQEFFADGLTDDLTTDLSHLAGNFVIARNTAFT